MQNKTPRKVIALTVGCSQSTISRELSRNVNKNGQYTWQKANELAMIRRERTCKNRKTKPWILHMALKLLVEKQWSPQQISGHPALQGIHISAERIYQAIRADPSGLLKQHCRHKLKYRRHGKPARKTAGRSLIPDRVSIHERPPEADGKRFGDFEMDLIVGKDQKSAVLTIIERMTNYLLQCKVPSKAPRHVAKCVLKLLLPFRDKVLTITTDNGMEFRDHKWLTKMLGCPVYFADPYCSGQKGAVENANGLLRQYFPKKTDFPHVTQQQLDQAQAKINARPRKKLGYSTPKIEFFKNFN